MSTYNWGIGYLFSSKKTMENILIFETLRGYFIFGDQKKFKNSYIYSRAVAHIFIKFF